MARAVLERRPEISASPLSIHDFVIQMVQLGELIIGKKINHKEVKESLAKMDPLTEQVHEYYDTREQTKKEKNAESHNRGKQAHAAEAAERVSHRL